MSAAEVITEALAAHRFYIGNCECGWPIPRNEPLLPAHETHQAEAVLAAIRAMTPEQQAEVIGGYVQESPGRVFTFDPATGEASDWRPEWVRVVRDV